MSTSIISITLEREKSGFSSYLDKFNPILPIIVFLVHRRSKYAITLEYVNAVVKFQLANLALILF